jgi:hypothetical protein
MHHGCEDWYTSPFRLFSSLSPNSIYTRAGEA